MYALKRQEMRVRARQNLKKLKIDILLIESTF